MRKIAVALLVLGLAACGSQSPQVVADEQLACTVDGILHPIANSVASLAPGGALVDTVANAAIQAYCGTLGGTPVQVTAAQLATALQDTAQAVQAATQAAAAAQAAAQAAQAAAAAVAPPAVKPAS